MRRGAMVCGGVASLWVGVASGGTLLDYNVVVTGTLDTRSHVDGRTFTRHLKVTNSPVFAMHESAGTGDTLTIAGSVTGSSMHVNRGTVRTRNALPGVFSSTTPRRSWTRR